MKKWQPYLGNADHEFEMGPATRRMKGSSPRAWLALKVLKRLEGRAFDLAARIAKWMKATPLRALSYDEASRLYCSVDSHPHFFAFPSRVWTVFGGHRARGRRIAYEYLLDRIDFSDGDCVIDVGANVGDLSLAFELIGRKVRMVAFEPSPEDFRALEKNLQLNPAVIEFVAHQCALWNDDAGSLEFHLKPGKADSSLLPIDGISESVVVPARRLDSVLKTHTGRFRLMKLEAEGAEPEVLIGAEGLLGRVDYICADVGFERGFSQESTLPAVTSFLSSRGFEVIGFEGSRCVLLFKNTSIA